MDYALSNEAIKIKLMLVLSIIKYKKHENE